MRAKPGGFRPLAIRPLFWGFPCDLRLARARFITLSCDRSGGPDLGLAQKTLEKLRVIGGGPRFRKHGRRVLYRREDLDAWSEERVRTPTSDSGVG